jgi:predicted transcriptional regulator
LKVVYVNACQEGCSSREIARRLGIGRNTVSKYRTGDPKLLYQYGIRQSKLDVYRDYIVQCLNNGYSKSKTIKSIYERGYGGGMTNAFDYLKKMEQESGKNFEPQPYVRTKTEALKYKTGSKGRDCDYITKMVYSAISG